MSNRRATLTMQDAILALQEYWTAHGCMIAQPFNTEVGAGTANPATALRVLGPEPWHVAYVEPSVRPDDSRYGENPNRLQTHTQFQVILKPEPGNPQELYLGSIEALGVDLQRHDVRFVQDNWNSPALGAWGLGWEVWLDGLEITQFTYFQQAAGVSLEPVSVEITYGLERILMALQGVAHFKEIEFAPGISYGEVFGQPEYEMSRYYLDDADVDLNQQIFGAYAAEAQHMLDLKLPIPAYVFVLKCSHIFNVLDSRGAISTTERARAFGLMRKLTKDAGVLWVERRAALGHPLGETAPLPTAAAPVASAPVAGAPADAAGTLLFEIGVEELPHADVRESADQVHRLVTSKLAATRLPHGEIAVYSTPRRIVLTIDDVAAREDDAEELIRGPRVSASYDAEQQPTRALKGFADRQGASVADVLIRDYSGIGYAAVLKTQTGRTATQLLSGMLAEVVAELRAERNMRWSDPSLSFSRPIRCLLALLGEKPIPVTVSALTSGTTTRVQRTAVQPEISVPQADAYPAFLQEHGIIVDRELRRQLVIEGTEQLAGSVAGTVRVHDEAALIEEITDLVEFPTPILGSFDERYLELPDSVLTTVMRKHQRYLPIYRDRQLTSHFVAVANGLCDENLVRSGNEAVLRARFEDASFFWRADLAVAPQSFRKRLEKLTFEDRLGSVAERADRIGHLAAGFAEHVGLSDDEQQVVQRAGALAKFDLASQMVIELSSLAGVMAEEYALRAGETPSVAKVLAEMELPRSSGGALPGSPSGALLSLADRFDLLTGMFIIGATPTGRSDPFGVRRAAIGIVNVLRTFPELQAISVPYGVTQAAGRYEEQGVPVLSACIPAAIELVTRRYEQQLLDSGYESRFIAAVMPLAGTPAQANAALSVLVERAATDDFVATSDALQRVQNILPADSPAGADLKILTDPAEQELRAAVDHIAEVLQGETGLARFLDSAAALPAAIGRFFDSVLVMDPDPEMRLARLALLARVRDLASGVIDWRAL